MIYKIKTHVVLLIILVSIVFTGCSHNDSASQYYNAAKQFNKMYIGTVESLETADAMKAMEQLQTEKNEKNIEELNKLLETIEKNIPKERAELGDSFKRRYTDLLFLKDSYSKFSELNKDEKRRIGIVLVNIGMDIENWKDKNSTIVWQ